MLHNVAGKALHLDAIIVKQEASWFLQMQEEDCEEVGTTVGERANRKGEGGPKVHDCLFVGTSAETTWREH